MTALDQSSLATMYFIVSWKSDYAEHEEHYYAGGINMWRDIFPDVLREKLLRCRPGDEITHAFSPGDIPGVNDTPSPHLTIPLLQWQPPGNGSSWPPFVGRYYPQGFVRGIAGVYPQTLTPMRIVSADSQCFTVDCGHPLQGKKLEVKIRLEEVSRPGKERGGRCSDWLADILENGPGMEGCIADNPIQFDRHWAYQRRDTAGDLEFYDQPRLVSHIDSQADKLLAGAVRRFLSPGGRVLDLMASIDSHLPRDLGLEALGLGMNSREMAANSALSEHLVHDLNEDPRLPFADSLFDAVLCNLSYEYLTRPEQVLRETARVLKPSGTLLISFSNRWFPSKVTRLWTELHEFERMGLVLQQCRALYTDMTTLSYRNWPRPVDDRHYPALQTSDPIYVVTGRTRPGP